MSLKKYFLKHWLGVAGLLVLGVFWMGAQMVDSIFFGNAVTAISNQNYREFIKDMVIAFSGISVFALCIPINDHFREILKQKMETELRLDITDSINRLKYAQVKENDTAKYVSWMTNDVSIVDAQGFENIFDALQTLTAVLVNAIMIVKYHYSLLLLVMALSVLMILGPKILQKPLEKHSRAFSQANEKLTEEVTDVFDGYNALYILGQKQTIKRQVAQSSHFFAKRKIGLMTIRGENNGLINWISLFSQAAIVVLSGWLAFRGFMKVGSIITCSSLGGVIFGNLTAFSFSIVGVRSTKPILEKFQISTDEVTTPQQVTLPDFHEQLKMDRVTYQYPGQAAPTLRDFSLQIDRARKYALIAPSGYGKSTILNLLFAMYEDYQGKLSIDGVDYRQLSEDAIQSQMLYVDQHPYIFAASLRDNIVMGRAVTPEKLTAVCEICGIDQFLGDLSAGLETNLRHSGSNLSGGQMQRIALARMLLSDRPILLLDEITSALDADTALRIEQNILQQPDKTVVMVTHNLRADTRPLFDEIVDLTKLGIAD